MRTRRIVPALISLCLLVPLTVEAAHSVYPSTTAGIESAALQSTWAQEAFLFLAAQNALDSKDLRPTDDATRAELADMVTRLFGQTEEAELFAYSDPPEDAATRSAMARAVAMGIFRGDGEKLDADGTLTREQTCVVLARAYGYGGGTIQDLADFTDKRDVSFWAVSAVGALVRAGVLHGVNAQLSPNDPITRQELAQLLFNLTATQRDDGEFVSIITNKAPEAGSSANSCILTAGSELTLDNVRISDRLVLRANSPVTLHITKGSEIGTLALAAPAGSTVTIENGASVGQISAICGTDSVTGSAQSLYSETNASVSGGAFSNIAVGGGTLSIAQGASVGALTVLPYADDASVALSGAADTAVLYADNVSISGSGSLAAATTHGENDSVSISGASVQSEPDVGLTGVTLEPQTPSAAASYQQPTAYAKFTVNGVSTSWCDGAEDGVRYCSVRWYVDGTLLYAQDDYPLKDGALLEAYKTFAYSRDMADSTVFTLSLTYDGQTVSGSQTIALNNASDAYYDQLEAKAALSTVQTLNIEASVLYDTSLYSNMDLTGWVKTLSGGTTVIYRRYKNGAGYVIAPDGTTGWVSTSALSISPDYDIQKTDYTALTKEAFVNAKGYSSSTGMLVWVSLKCQKVNVFTGSKGSWTLQKTFSACTGENTTPTPVGVYSYLYRNAEWDFSTTYVKPALVFFGGFAFHSRVYNYDGTLNDATIGIPASHGCVRMLDSELQWLDQNMKLGTTVVIY